jgi:hypothetical protein
VRNGFHEYGDGSTTGSRARRTLSRRRGLVVDRMSDRVPRLCGDRRAGLLFAPAHGFLPAEDQGRVQLQFTLPAGATQGRTLEAAKIARYFLTQGQGRYTRRFLTIGGSRRRRGGAECRRAASSTSSHWDERQGQAEHTADAIANARRAISATRCATRRSSRSIRRRSAGSATRPALRSNCSIPAGSAAPNFKPRRDQLRRRGERRSEADRRCGSAICPTRRAPSRCRFREGRCARHRQSRCRQRRSRPHGAAPTSTTSSIAGA